MRSERACSIAAERKRVATLSDIGRSPLATGLLAIDALGLPIKSIAPCACLAGAGGQECAQAWSDTNA
jgi:hypothetical protein